MDAPPELRVAPLSVCRTGIAELHARAAGCFTRKYSGLPRDRTAHVLSAPLRIAFDSGIEPRSTRDGKGRHLGVRRIEGIGQGPQEDRNSRSASSRRETGAELYSAAIAAHDRVAGPQSKSGRFLFAGRERMKQCSANIFRHALAIIGHHQPDTVPAVF